MINASNHKHKEKKTNKQTKQTTIHAKKEITRRINNKKRMNRERQKKGRREGL